MILKNYFSASYDFTPAHKNKRVHRQIDKGTMTTNNNTIIIMNGPMPDTNVLYEVNDLVEFETIYGADIVTKFENQEITYSYDKEKKERIVRKLPDALDFVYAIDASIGWFAILLEEKQQSILSRATKAERLVGWNYGERDSRTFRNIFASNHYWNTNNNSEFIIELDVPVVVGGGRAHCSSSTGFTLQGSNNKIDWTEIYITDAGDYVADLYVTFSNMTAFTFYKVKLNMGSSSYYVYEFELHEKKTDGCFLFSDSVGVWEDEYKVMTLDNINGNQGSANILKDMTLAMRDTCDLEHASLPITNYQIDNNPGVININPISESFITNTERTEPLVISGTTIDIEDNQVVDIELDGTTYNTSVSSNAWTITIGDISGLISDTYYPIKVSVRDIAGNLSTAEQSVLIAGDNLGPVITVVGTLTIDEDTDTTTPITVIDAGETVASVLIGSVYGSAQYDEENNMLSYSPGANFNGTDTITITATDALGAETVKEIVVTVNSVNDLPSISIANNNVTVDEDNSVEIPLNIYDVEGVPAVTATMSNGSVIWDANTSVLTYTGNQDFNGDDTINIVVTDSNGAIAEEVVYVTVNSVNDTPIVIMVDNSTDEDNSVNIPFSTSDVDGTVEVIESSALNGTAVINGNSVDYTPNQDFNGVDTVSIALVDNDGGITNHSVTVTVIAVNDASEMVVENTLSITVDDVTDIPFTLSDIDGDTTTMSATVINGIIVVDEVGKTIRYTAPSVEGSDTITVTLNDGTVDTIEVINITVNKVNSLPEIVIDNSSTNEDVSVNIPFTATDSDGTIDTITVSALNGTTVINGNSVDYTPNTNFNGEDTVTIVITDNQGGSVTSNKTVTVTAVNDASTIEIVETLDSTVDGVTDIPFTLTDVDDDLMSVTVSVTNGSATVDEVGKTIRYTAPSEAGSDTITITVNDGTVDTIKTVNVTVTQGV